MCACVGCRYWDANNLDNAESGLVLHIYRIRSLALTVCT